VNECPIGKWYAAATRRASLFLPLICLKLQELRGAFYAIIEVRARAGVSVVRREGYGLWKI
jgi:hypothetical protein